MSIPLSAAEVLNREFLEIRARLLQVAAALDRLDRAQATGEGSADFDHADVRLERIDGALAVLAGDEPNRAAQIQMIFSREYSASWRGDFGLKNGRA